MLLPPWMVLDLGGENRHGLAVTAVGVGAGHLALLDAELLRQGLLQTGAVEGGEGGELLRLQAGMDQRGERGHIGRVEDHDDVLDVRAVLADVVTELGGDLAVALQEVFTGHSFLARRTAGGDDVSGILERDGGIDGGRDVHARERAVVHLGEDALETGLENVVQADVGGQAEHRGRLGHVGADHPGGADDDKLLFSQELHNVICCFKNGFSAKSVAKITKIIIFAALIVTNLYGTSQL